MKLVQGITYIGTCLQHEEGHVLTQGIAGMDSIVGHGDVDVLDIQDIFGVCGSIGVR